MSLDVDVLSELYVVLKEYIPSKDRQAAADNAMSVLVEYLSDKDLKVFGGTDSYTKRSLEEYADDYDEDDDGDGEDE